MQASTELGTLTNIVIYECVCIAWKIEVFKEVQAEIVPSGGVFLCTKYRIEWPLNGDNARIPIVDGRDDVLGDPSPSQGVSCGELVKLMRRNELPRVNAVTTDGRRILDLARINLERDLSIGALPNITGTAIRTWIRSGILD